MADKRHEAWLRFQRSILDILIGKSREDLLIFRNVAQEQNKAILPLIDEYISLAINAETDVQVARPSRSKKASSKQMHLFDLLRERTFFPQNADLVRFAERVLPNMRTNRFDKMSRSEIAARIVDYIESRGPGSRDVLEESMRDALAEISGKEPREAQRDSFMSKWERIIKGGES